MALPLHRFLLPVGIMDASGCGKITHKHMITICYTRKKMTRRKCCDSLNIKKLVKEDRLDKRLLDFDLQKLSEAIKIRRDNLFKYLGIQILFDRYFIRVDGKIMETIKEGEQVKPKVLTTHKKYST